MTDPTPAPQPLDLEAIGQDGRGLIYASDGTRGSDRVARLLRAVPALLDEVERLRAQVLATRAEAWEDATAMARAAEGARALGTLPDALNQCATEARADVPKASS